MPLRRRRRNRCPLRPDLLARLQTPDCCIDCAPALLLGELDRLAQSLVAAPPVDSLRLVGRRELRSNNSWMHNAPRLVKGKARHQLLVHPQDLAARGIVDGARARLRSRTGAIRIEARASESMMPGVVCLPHGFGHQRSGVRLSRAALVDGESYVDLTDPLTLDVPSGNAALSGLPVWLEADA